MPLTDFIQYRHGVLHVEGVALNQAREAFDDATTPVYYYSAGAMTDAYDRLARALEGLDATILYAMKANPSLAIVNHFAGLGAGADIVSEGEYRQARKAGVDPKKIIFAGVGKRGFEIAFTHMYGLGFFSAESEPELAVIAEACSEGAMQPPDVLLRVNPDVVPKTHKKISTGQGETKFGIPIERIKAVYAAAQADPRLRVRGLHIHIGSQLTDIAPLRAAFEKIAGLVREMRAEGLTVDTLDLGGGLGVRYHQEETIDPADYANLLRTIIAPLGVKIFLEPGRFLIANAGLLLTRVVYVKQAMTKQFLIVDAAMNDLIRPTLYDAWHDILPVRQAQAGGPRAVYDVVGPVCETGDYFAHDRELPALAQGDLVAILSAGAYANAMASNYNARPMPGEYLVRGEACDVIRFRQSYNDVYGRDRLPAWAEPDSLTG